MEPRHFHKTLQRIIKKTIPLLTAGSAMTLGCNTNLILGSEHSTPDASLSSELHKEQTLPDQTHHETTIPPDPTHPETSTRPPETTLPPDPTHPETSTQPPENTLPPDLSPPTKCPITSCKESESSRSEKNQRYILSLDTTIPSPLSYQKCLELCSQKLRELCSDSTGRDYTTIRITQCEEQDWAHQRVMDCRYDISRSCAVAGRRPVGFQEDTTPTSSLPTDQTQQEREIAGRYFAKLAQLEAAAVIAFEHLYKELKAHNAPKHLIGIAQEAIAEEIEHSTLMTALATQFQSTPPPAQSAPFSLRPLVEIAIDNAREGCTREAFGALMGMWQSLHAMTPSIRAVMGRIAFEESRHAALSWAIDSWARTQLPEEDNLLVDFAHQQALLQLQRELNTPPSIPLVRIAGYPTPLEAGYLYDNLKNELWEASQVANV